MIPCKMKIDIKNHFGEIKKNTICNIKKSMD